MRSLLILSMATVLAAPIPTMSGFVDAPKLVAFCSDTSPSAAAARATCYGYVLGSVDQVMAQQARRAAAARTICPPLKLTAEMAVQVVSRHAAYARDAKGIGAAGLVRFAMEDAYPCHARRVVLAPGVPTGS